MTEEREFEGRDLEEALAEAARAMRIPEPDLHYRIVEQGRRGLFGLGAKSVRISVMPPIGPLPDPMADIDLRVEVEPAQSDAPPAARAARDPQPARRTKTPAAPVRPRRRQRRKNGRRGAAEKNEPARRPPRERPAVDDGAPPSASAEAVAATLQRMLDLMGLKLEATAAGGEGVAIRLDGADRQLLAERDAELLAALQFLLNRMARRAWPDVERIELIASGRPRRDDDELVGLVHEVAQQVESSRQPKRLHPMNAYERRLVHLTVREYERLGSRSEGSGALKRVTIFSQRRD